MGVEKYIEMHINYSVCILNANTIDRLLNMGMIFYVRSFSEEHSRTQQQAAESS